MSGHRNPDLEPARGCLIGLVLAAAIWALGLVLAWAVAAFARAGGW